MANIIPRRTIVQLRFVPTFDFFEQVARIGKDVMEATGFDEWLRDPLQGVIFDRQQLKVIAFRNGEIGTTIDTIDPKGIDHLKWGVEVVMKTARFYGQEEFLRVGVRQWYAISIGTRNEAAIAKKLQDKYYNTSSFESVLGLYVEDHAQILEFQEKGDSRKTARLEFGAMSRESKEWQMRLHYEPGKEPHLTRTAVEAIISDLPADFIFIDFDRGFRAKSDKELLTLESVSNFLNDLLRTEIALPRQFIQDLG